MMPHLVRWYDEYSDYGLIIMALHRQEMKPEVLRERCKALNIRFTVCEGGNLAGSPLDGIPHCGLFLPNGDCAFDGHPKDVEPVLRRAVGAMLVSDITSPTKAMEPVVEMLKKGSPTMDALKKRIWVSAIKPPHNTGDVQAQGEGEQSGLR